MTREIGYVNLIHEVGFPVYSAMTGRWYVECSCGREFEGKTDGAAKFAGQNHLNNLGKEEHVCGTMTSQDMPPVGTPIQYLDAEGKCRIALVVVPWTEDDDFDCNLAYIKELGNHVAGNVYQITGVPHESKAADAAKSCWREV